MNWTKSRSTLRKRPKKHLCPKKKKCLQRDHNNNISNNKWIFNKWINNKWIFVKKIGIIIR